ncbi:hypothetical protein [uncultured Cohaesibacter sp.]|uniref:hypothetical protein n=1 Tax=uncultured Cohaesibacter sp. TaxID=1002546 RepID=UPI0029C6D18F|nr:hypothetical protein [uncultured Cohaesibacter sp.]
MEQTQVGAHCPHCGGAVVKATDNKTGEAVAACEQCGVRFGRWADLEDRAKRFIIDDARKQVLKVIKRGGRGILK